MLPKIQARFDFEIRMRAVVQRVTNAAVEVDGKVVSEIRRGVLVINCMLISDLKKGVVGNMSR